MLQQPTTADYRTFSIPLDRYIDCIALPVSITKSHFNIPCLHRLQQNCSEHFPILGSHSQRCGEYSRLVLPLVMLRIEAVLP